MVEAALEARAVHKLFEAGRSGQRSSVVALADIDLSIARGETLCLIGESGSGKSTLLRHFNRLEEPTSGELFVHGRPISELEPIELRRRTGYVQQEGGLLPHWTVERNVELVPQLLGWTLERRRQRSRELLAMVGLPAAEFAERLPQELSGGQRQRVAFARALAADPPVVLLDEPFGALDPITRAQLGREFVSLRRGLGKTMVLVTHDMNEALRLGDRLAVLRAGRLEQLGTASELSNDPVPYVRELLQASGLA